MSGAGRAGACQATECDRRQRGASPPIERRRPQEQVVVVSSWREAQQQARRDSAAANPAAAASHQEDEEPGIQYKICSLKDYSQVPSVDRPGEMLVVASGYQLPQAPAKQLVKSLSQDRKLMGAQAKRMSECIYTAGGGAGRQVAGAGLAEEGREPSAGSQRSNSRSHQLGLAGTESRIDRVRKLFVAPLSLRPTGANKHQQQQLQQAHLKEYQQQQQQVGPSSQSVAATSSDALPGTSGQRRSPLRQKPTKSGGFRVYGCPLHLANNIYPITCFGRADIYKQQSVPYVLARLCNYIEENSSHLTHEGIFRVNGNARLMGKLKTLFDHLGDAPLESESVDVATSASMLKMYLRELPEPLIPTRMNYYFITLAKKYSPCLGGLSAEADLLQATQRSADLPAAAAAPGATGGAAAKSPAAAAARRNSSALKERQHSAFSRDLTKLLRKLPIENYNLLKYLACFLHRVSLKQEYNKMCAEALGIVFGPNVFRVRSESFKGLKEQELSNKIMASIISNYRCIFDSELTDPLGNLVKEVYERLPVASAALLDSQTAPLPAASSAPPLESPVRHPGSGSGASRLASVLGPLAETSQPAQPSSSKQQISAAASSSPPGTVPKGEPAHEKAKAKLVPEEAGKPPDQQQQQVLAIGDEEDEESYSISSGSESYCSSDFSQSLASSYDDDDDDDEDQDDEDGDDDDEEEEEKEAHVPAGQPVDEARRRELAHRLTGGGGQRPAPRRPHLNRKHISSSECPSDTSYTPTSSHSDGADEPEEEAADWPPAGDAAGQRRKGSCAACTCREVPVSAAPALMHSSSVASRSFSSRNLPNCDKPVTRRRAPSVQVSGAQVMLSKTTIGDLEAGSSSSKAARLTAPPAGSAGSVEAPSAAAAPVRRPHQVPGVLLRRRSSSASSLSRIRRQSRQRLSSREEQRLRLQKARARRARARGGPNTPCGAAASSKAAGLGAQERCVSGSTDRSYLAGDDMSSVATHTADDAPQVPPARRSNSHDESLGLELRAEAGGSGRARLLSGSVCHTSDGGGSSELMQCSAISLLGGTCASTPKWPHRDQSRTGSGMSASKAREQAGPRCWVSQETAATEEEESGVRNRGQEALLEQMRANRKLARQLKRLARHAERLGGFSPQMELLVAAAGHNQQHEQEYQEEPAFAWHVDQLSALALAAHLEEALDGLPEVEEVAPAASSAVLASALAASIGKLARRHESLRAICEHNLRNHSNCSNQLAAAGGGPRLGRGGRALSEAMPSANRRWEEAEASANKLAAAARRASEPSLAAGRLAPQSQSSELLREAGDPRRLAAACCSGALCPWEFVVRIEAQLAAKRRRAGRLAGLLEMSSGELAGEKLELQRNLLRYEHHFGRPTSRLHINLVGHIYERYRTVKQLQRRRCRRRRRGEPTESAAQAAAAHGTNLQVASESSSSNSTWQPPATTSAALEHVSELPSASSELLLEGQWLSRVPRDRLCALPASNQLNSLSLANNQIARLDDNAFVCLAAGLRILNLQNNLLESLAEGAFNLLAQLQVLQLENNRLAKLPSRRALHPLRSLKHLNLAHNRIQRLEPDALGPANGRLVSLDLRSNPVVQVSPLALRHLTRLKTLSLSQWPAFEAPHWGPFEGLTELRFLHLDRTNLSSLPDTLCAHSGKLASLVLKSNQLERVPQLANCHKLLQLDLSYNRLAGSLALNFSAWPSLLDLYLSHNRLVALEAQAFAGLRSLETLDLNHNQLASIHAAAFLPLRATLRHLNIAQNPQLDYLPGAGLERLTSLQAYGNQLLRRLPRLARPTTLRLTYAYHCCDYLSPDGSSAKVGGLPLNNQAGTSLLSRLLELFGVNNGEQLADTRQLESEEAWPEVARSPGSEAPPFNLSTVILWPRDAASIDYRQALGNLSRAQLLHLSAAGDIGGGGGRQHAPQTSCLPAPGPFLPCRDLFDTWWLRLGVWCVFLSAFAGNLLVIIVLGSARRSSASSALSTIMWPAGHSKRHIDVPRFLVINLALADLLMALYLGILALVDLSTLGEFKLYAIRWQRSSACQLAGFLAVLSSELSVFILAIITLERNYAITNAVHLNRRLSLQKAVLIMFLGYAFALAMALVPLGGQLADYRKYSICLPLELAGADGTGSIGGPSSPLYMSTLLAINTLSFLLLLGCYLRMYCAIRGSQAWNANDLRIAKRMSVLVVTDFLCWMPIILAALGALWGRSLVGAEGIKALAIFVLPLNSIANPFLYAITTKKFKRDLEQLRRRLGSLASCLCGLSTRPHQPLFNRPENAAYSRHAHYQRNLLLEARKHRGGGGGGGPTTKARCDAERQSLQPARVRHQLTQTVMPANHQLTSARTVVYCQSCGRAQVAPSLGKAQLVGSSNEEVLCNETLVVAAEDGQPRIFLEAPPESSIVEENLNEQLQQESCSLDSRRLDSMKEAVCRACSGSSTPRRSPDGSLQLVGGTPLRPAPNHQSHRDLCLADLHTAVEQPNRCASACASGARPPLAATSSSRRAAGTGAATGASREPAHACGSCDITGAGHRSRVSSRSGALSWLLLRPLANAWSSIQISLAAGGQVVNASSSSSSKQVGSQTRPQHGNQRADHSIKRPISPAGSALPMGQSLKVSSARRMSRSLDVLTRQTLMADQTVDTSSFSETSTTHGTTLDDRRTLLSTRQSSNQPQRPPAHLGPGMAATGGPASRRQACMRCRSWSPALFGKLEDCITHIKSKIPRLNQAGAHQLVSYGGGGAGFTVTASDRCTSCSSSDSLTGKLYTTGHSNARPDSDCELASLADDELMQEGPDGELRLASDESEDKFSETEPGECVAHRKSFTSRKGVVGRAKLRRQRSSNSDTVSTKTARTMLTNVGSSFESGSNIPPRGER